MTQINAEHTDKIAAAVQSVGDSIAAAIDRPMHHGAAKKVKDTLVPQSFKILEQCLLDINRDTGENIPVFSYHNFSENSENSGVTFESPSWVVTPLWEKNALHTEYKTKCSISVGLIERGSPVLGVCYFPFNGDMYMSYPDGHAYTCNPSAAKPWRPITAASTGADTSGQSADQTPYLSNPERVCLAAAGELSATPKIKAPEYALVAVDAILRQAGGILKRTDDGNPVIYHKPFADVYCVAGHPTLLYNMGRKEAPKAWQDPNPYAE